MRHSQVEFKKEGNTHSIHYIFSDEYTDEEIEDLNKRCDNICMRAFLKRTYDGISFSSGFDHTMKFPNSDFKSISNAAKSIARLLNVKVYNVIS